MPNIVEMPSFTLKDGVTEADFLPVHERFNREFMREQPGYISHKLIRDGDRWYDLAAWESLEEMEAAFQDIYENPAAAEYLSLIDQIGTDDEISTFTVVKSY